MDTTTDDDLDLDQLDDDLDLDDDQLVDDQVDDVVALYELPDAVVDALANIAGNDADLALVLSHLLADVARVARFAETLVPIVDQVGQFATKVQTDGIAAVLPAGGLMGLLGGN